MKGIFLILLLCSINIKVLSAQEDDEDEKAIMPIAYKIDSLWQVTLKTVGINRSWKEIKDIKKEKCIQCYKYCPTCFHDSKGNDPIKYRLVSNIDSLRNAVDTTTLKHFAGSAYDIKPKWKNQCNVPIDSLIPQIDFEKRYYLEYNTDCGGGHVLHQNQRLFYNKKTKQYRYISLVHFLASGTLNGCLMPNCYSIPILNRKANFEFHSYRYTQEIKYIYKWDLENKDKK